MPPLLGFSVKLGGVKGGDEGLGLVSLANNFYTIGGKPSGGQVRYKPFTNATPAGFLAAPLNATAGPGQLLSVKQPAAGANDPIGQVGTRALKDMARRPGMF